MTDSSIRQKMHQLILSRMEDLREWYAKKSLRLKFPIYSSMDIRDSGHKLTVVDANVYPAGFNNICTEDLEQAPHVLRHYLQKHYESLQNVLLLVEEHTHNAFYWSNVKTLKEIVQRAGFTCRVAFPRALDTPVNLEHSLGGTIAVTGICMQDHQIKSSDREAFCPDLVICNNDFSTAYPQLAEQGLQTAVNPPYQLGWHSRKKHMHFEIYNELAKEFADILEVDSWHFQIESRHFQGFCVKDEESREQLALEVESFLEAIQVAYKKRGISATPSVFVKNNTGTYGMGVMQVTSSKEIREMNNKARKKMRMGKGGNPICDLLLQEGVPSLIRKEGVVAEPVTYCFGGELVGGFLRSHEKKTEAENLNSPGAVFQRLCVSGLSVDAMTSPMENVYGWVSRLSSLSIAREAELLKAHFVGYNFSSP